MNQNGTLRGCGSQGDGLSVAVSRTFAGAAELLDPGLLAGLSAAGLAWRFVLPADPGSLSAVRRIRR